MVQFNRAHGEKLCSRIKPVTQPKAAVVRPAVLHQETEILAIQPSSKTGFAVLPSHKIVSLVCHYEFGVTRWITIWGVLICKK
jgi:hypothetical protein